MKRIAAVLVGLVLVCAVVLGATRTLSKVPKHLEGMARIVYTDSVLGFEAATAIIPHVTGVADRDPTTHAWRYTYTVENDATSDNAIKTFALSPVPSRPLTIDSPAHWMGARGYEGDTSAVVWDVVDAQEPPANWDSLSPYPSIYDLQPGSNVTFSFVHTLAPVMTTYYIQGFFYPDTSAESNGPINPSIFQSSLTGSVVGPGSIVGVGQAIPGTLARLKPPVPNPTAGRVSVAFYLPTRAPARVTIHDIAGRRVRTLVDGVFEAGYHSADWDGRDEKGVRVHAGVYFYRLFVNGNSVGERRVTILR
jgi:hypothetical protein